MSGGNDPEEPFRSFPSIPSQYSESASFLAFEEQFRILLVAQEEERSLKVATPDEVSIMRISSCSLGVEGLADWVGGCRGGILGVEGDIPYLIRQ